MTRFTSRYVALAASALALSLGAHAQTTPSASSAASAVGATAQGARAGAADARRADIARADRRFIEAAAMGGMAEVEMGKMAQQKASSAQVREFAQRMVIDHTKANEELMALAGKKGVQPPAALDRSQRNDVEKIGKLSGAAFDREYMARQVGDHRKTVSEFKKAADSARDADLKGWAAKTLPTLEAHYKVAQTLHDAVKGGHVAAAASAAKP